MRERVDAQRRTDDIVTEGHLAASLATRVLSAATRRHHVAAPAQKPVGWAILPVPPRSFRQPRSGDIT
jgi:hypothetical protein